MLTIQNVKRVYNGRSGCMCGCKGTYGDPVEQPRRAKTLLTKVINDSERRYCSSSHSVYIDDRSRTTVVYLTDSTPAPEGIPE